MDFKSNSSLSNDDLVGVLRTLWLFLESIDFNETIAALENECLSRGYTISNPSKASVINRAENESSKSNSKKKKCECVHFESNSHNLELEEEEERELLETDAPTRGSKALNDRRNDVVRKTYSNSSLISNKEIVQEVSPVNGHHVQKEHENNRDIKKQFCQLQNEHQKLMAVTSELTQALQTQLLGQSESLNATLTSCQNIYPDLFNSPKRTKMYCLCNKDTEISTKTTTNETTVPDETKSEEDHSPALSETNNSSSLVIVTEKEEKCLQTDGVITRNSYSKISVKSHSTISSARKNSLKESKRPKSCNDNLLKESSKQSIESSKREQQQPESKEEKVCRKLPEIFILNEKLKTPREACKSNFGICIVHQLFDLDFPQIKEDMMHGSDDLKLILIQALRWRITHNNSATRSKVVVAYTSSDLLELRAENDSSSLNMIESYLSTKKENCHLLQEEMLRFLNSLASLSVGRDYLCQNDELLVKILVPLITETRDSQIELKPIARDMLIATLQKLSLRYRQRTLMLASGLLEHLITFLSSQHKVLNEYCMEYSTALLMNLCLHKEARELVALRATEVIRLLIALLNENYSFCMPYVNGATYSLLLNPIINEEAKKLEFGKLIMYQIENTEGEMRRQLEIILKLHQGGDVGEDDCSCNANIELEEEGDLLEPELDQKDSLNVQPCGEKILENYKTLYTVFGPEIGFHRRCKCFVLSDKDSYLQPEKIKTEPRPSVEATKPNLSEEKVNTEQRPSVGTTKSNLSGEKIKNGRRSSVGTTKSNLSEEKIKSEHRPSVETTKSDLSEEKQNTEQRPSVGTTKSNLSGEKIKNGRRPSVGTTKSNLSEEKIKSEHRPSVETTKSDLSEEKVNTEQRPSVEPTNSNRSDETVKTGLRPSAETTNSNLSEEKAKTGLRPSVETMTSNLSEENSIEDVKNENLPSENSLAVEDRNLSRSSMHKKEKSERKRRVNKIPSSFTKTIPMQSSQSKANPIKCNNPFCPFPYVRTMPEQPKQNSSAQNPPYACNYSNQFSTCYRESYNFNDFSDDSEKPCVCCSTRNKYSCNCYNVIKESLEDGTDYVNKPSDGNVKEICTNMLRFRSIPSCQCEHTAPQRLWVQKSSSDFDQQECTNNRRLGTNKKNSVNSDVKFSYKGLLRTFSSDGCFHECSNSKVNYRCYDDVFLSRPKILRTPP